MSSKRTAPSAGPSKRARFASPPPATAVDISTSHLEDDLTTSTAAKSKARRSLKGEEGYDSDSSDDGEGVVPSRNKKTRGGATGDDDMDEDEDIFGGGGDLEDEADSAKDAKKGGKDFLNINDIEGQEFDGTSRLRGDVNDDEDDDLDSEEEAEAAARARGLDGPMGYEMTSFNMKAELTEGRMTADGENFISNDRDPGDEHDKWLDGMNRAEIKKARKGAKDRERMELEREKKEEAEANDEHREERLMGDIVGLLDRGETVLEALQRLGGEVEKERKKKESEPTAGHKKKSWSERQRERKAMLQGSTDGSMEVE
jgi:CD2 antigen cytoplasmic tail-binding protein 2